MIEQYLDTLRRQLPGPWTARRELLRELGDGLRDAASVYQLSGMTRAEAERRAIEESGTAEELASHYRRTLAVIQGRRTATIYALSAPLSILAWSYVWADPGAAAVMGGEPQSDLASFCWALIDYMGAFSGAVAVGALVLLVLAVRRGWSYRPLVLVPALVGIAHVTVTMVASTIGNLESGGGVFGRVVTVSPLLAVLGLASILVACWQCSSSLRTIRATRLVPQ